MLLGQFNPLYDVIVVETLTGSSQECSKYFRLAYVSQGGACELFDRPVAVVWRSMTKSVIGLTPIDIQSRC